MLKPFRVSDVHKWPFISHLTPHLKFGSRECAVIIIWHKEPKDFSYPSKTASLDPSFWETVSKTRSHSRSLNTNIRRRILNKIMEGSFCIFNFNRALMTDNFALLTPESCASICSQKVKHMGSKITTQNDKSSQFNLYISVVNQHRLYNATQGLSILRGRCRQWGG